jgi:hypothetical protein
MNDLLPSTPNRHDCLVRFRGRWSEDEFSGNMEEHYADSVSITVSCVTNTPGDPVSLGSLHVTMIGDGFYLISRTRVGGGSELLASGKIDDPRGCERYGDHYVKMALAATE